MPVNLFLGGPPALIMLASSWAERLLRSQLLDYLLGQNRA